MFEVRDSKNELSMEHHLAHIVALLGPPPASFVNGNDMALEYFNTDGECLICMIAATMLLIELTSRILERNDRNSKNQP
jgi:hypothetical protein